MGQSAGVQEDLLGTKRLTTNASGTPIGTFASLPFGDGYTPTGTDPDPSHFAVLDHDAESNTDHAQFRQYSPTSATWMSPDPYDGSYNQRDPQSLNRYVYAGNNPLLYVDPSGLQLEVICKPTYTTAIWYNSDTNQWVALPIIVGQSCGVVDVGPDSFGGPPGTPTGPGSSGGGGVTRGGSTSAPNNNQQPKSPARNQCEANAAASLDKVGSEKVSWSAVKAQLPHDIIEGAVVGAAAGCAAGAAATSWTGPGAAAGCGAGAVDGAGWGALWGGALTFGRAIYDGTSGLIAYHNAMNACAAIP